MARPGIMLYFDMLGPIRVLPDAEKGRLLVAMLEYGQSGTVPQFDGMLALAWEFVKPKLDRDEDNYENSRNQRAYAAFCKKRWRLKLPKISFEEWVAMDDDERKMAVDFDNETQREQRAVDFVASRYPSTVTSASSPTPSPTLTSTPVSTAAAANSNNIYTGDDGNSTDIDRKVKVMNGSLGKGVVFLSEAQIESLLEEMGIEVFDYYVDKLSAFIIKNDAKVANHYETILKWYREDGNT